MLERSALVAASLILGSASGCTTSQRDDTPGEAVVTLVRQIELIPAEGRSVWDADWIDDTTFVVVREPGTSIEIRNWSRGRVEFDRRGTGPGEFESVTSLAVHQGKIVAVDGALRRASRWNRLGKLEAELPLNLSRIGDVWSTDSGIVVRSHNEFASKIVLSRLDFAVGTHSTIRMIDISDPKAAAPCVYCKIGVGRSLSVAATVAGDSLYVLQRFDATGVETTAINRGVHRQVRLSPEEILCPCFQGE